MVMIRLAKIAVSAALAVFALIVAYDNVFDYNSNYPFVRHVLSMDTIFPDSVLRSRAIDSETMWRAAYALIIATEVSTGFLLALGAVVLLSRLRASASMFYPPRCDLRRQRPIGRLNDSLDAFLEAGKGPE